MQQRSFNIYVWSYSLLFVFTQQLLRQYVLIYFFLFNECTAIRPMDTL